MIKVIIKTFIYWNNANKLAGMTGLEPATSAVTGQCSNQLNYIPKSNNAKAKCKWCVWMDLNHRPSPYQRDALTNWATNAFNGIENIKNKNQAKNITQILSYNNSYGNYAGQYLNECLPNITGRMGGDEFPNGGWGEGALYNAGRAGDTIAGSGYASLIMGLDASRLYNGQLYRNNCLAVRPKSYSVFIYVRTA